VLVLSFSAPLQVAFCEITVTNPEGSPVPVARPQAVPGQPNELAVPVNITQAGRYIVRWRVSTYTHQRSNGRYIFTVQ
jgi:methionine-rich copper-binding protein CopC